MKGLISSSVLVLFLLAAPRAHADSAGTYHGGVVVETAPVLDRLYVRVTNDEGTSPWVQVTPDAGGDQDVFSSPEITAGNTTYQWQSRSLKKENPDGTWTRLGRQKNSKRTGELEGSEMDSTWNGGPGNNITSLPKPGPVIL